MTPLHLRIDVCTYRGLRDGVPVLLGLLRRRRARATFFVTLGPDSSGLALPRLLDPSFAIRMLRNRAASSYGWATAFYGTLLPSPLVGAGLPEVLKRIRDEGHEVGAHGWDHRRWQDGLPRYPRVRLRTEFQRMCDTFQGILGRRPASFAAPAWLVTDDLLDLEAEWGLAYASDIRGTRPFLPDRPGAVPQLPVTLPTMDECRRVEAFAGEVARRSQEQPGYCCYTAHAEMEGGRCAGVFEELLERVGRPVVPLEEAPRSDLPRGAIRRGRVPGRPYDVCLQSES